MSQSSSGLQYDELGFLIGLKKTGRDVAKIDQNVEQIISLLERALRCLKHLRSFITKSPDTIQTLMSWACHAGPTGAH